MRPIKCPKCEYDSFAEILYGLVVTDDSELNEKLNSGKTVLGGCCIDEDSPAWHCNKCKHEWGKTDPYA